MPNRPQTFTETLGLWTGSLIAPVFAMGSLLRRERILHPKGICFHVKVKPAASIQPPFDQVAQALSGDGLARLSAGLWHEAHTFLPDLLGFAIRFRIAVPPSTLPSESSQDILLLTARHVITLGIAALRTDQTDFLANHYYGLTHFRIGSIDKVELRISAKDAPGLQDVTTADDRKEDANPADAKGNSRYDKIRQAVQAGEVKFVMAALPPDARNHWQPIAEIELLEELDIDQNALEFWPFRSGQNIVPRGFINFLRPIPYVFSQYARAIFPHRMHAKVSMAQSQAEKDEQQQKPLQQTRKSKTS